MSLAAMCRWRVVSISWQYCCVLVYHTIHSCKNYVFCITEFFRFKDTKCFYKLCMLLPSSVSKVTGHFLVV